MEHTQEEKRKPRIGLILGVIIGTLLVLAVLYLLLFQGGFPWSGTKARTLTSVNLRQGPGIGDLIVLGHIDHDTA